MDWNLFKSFAAVAETGSLSAAARALNSSQPTIGRHIGELENALDLKLFERGKRGYALTEAGARLLENAAAMRGHADAIARRAAGQTERMEGTVRVTASEIIGILVLPDIVTRMRREEPGLAVEIVASDNVGNLLRGDADIAIRMMRPHQLDLVARHVGEIALMPCASRAYAAIHGLPGSRDDLLVHDIIGYDRLTLMTDGFRGLGFPVARDFFKLRSDNHMVHWEALKAGAGIGFAQAPLVRRTPELVSCLEDLPLPPLSTWLAMHGDLKTSRRMRFVADFLYEAMRDYARS
jgi:DNA-binding transcriptional LysR family regulator